MTHMQLAKRRERAASEPLVIQRVEEGFRVYAASEPKHTYIVSGSPDRTQCTCPDFQFHRNEPDWQCKHILAVLNEFSDIEIVAQNTDGYEAEERRAIQEESNAPKKRKSPNNSNGNNGANGSSQLLLKRSVSPDGRIDSLSVELSTPVDGLGADEIHARADRMLRVQSGVVKQFLDGPDQSNPTNAQRGNGNGNQKSAQRAPQASPNSQPAARPANSSGRESAVPARLVDVAGMNGKWGRRLFINVELNGRTLKLFGKADELIQHIRAAGYNAPEPFCEGASLDILCAVITKPSADGRFIDIDKVLPANPPPQSGPQNVRRIGR